MTAAVLAVDGGNSKTDVVLLDRRGKVLGAARGGGSNHAQSDPAAVMRVVDSLIARASGGPTANVADVGVLCLAGADYPSDERRLLAGAASYAWAHELMVRNDAFATLRAGTDSDAAVAVVCGAGVNCAGVTPDGRSARFPALGEISGDWGGGYDIGMAALTAAIRAQDGRGRRTVLADLVPRHFGFARPSSLVSAIYTGRVPQDRLVELPPLVFAADAESDAVAGEIVDRLATELVVMAAAILRRLRLTRATVDVVLGGGMLSSGYPRLIDAVSEGVLAVAPAARICVLDAAPVTGAALLGLAALGLEPAADIRAGVAAALREERSR